MVNKSLSSQLDQRENSPEFKKLSYLHPEERTIAYIPQDNKESFRSQPKYVYSNKVNLKLTRNKLSSSPGNQQSPRADKTFSPRHSMTCNVDGYFMNLRK